MPNYYYKAIQKDGSLARGELFAQEEKLAVDELHARGLIPVSVSLTGKRGGLTASFSFSDFFSKVRKRDVLDFTQEFATLISAGLPVDKSLRILVSVTECDKLKSVISDILSAVEEGSTLADAFGQHPRVFSRLYTNMVRAGEAGGVLEIVFEKLAEFLESSQQMRDFIVSSLIYPMLLVFVGLASVIILMVFVIPKFTSIFADMGKALPTSTQLLIDISNFLTEHYLIIIIFAIVLYILFKSFLNMESGRLYFDSLKLRVVYIKDLIRKTEVARFANTLGVLIKSGVPILSALSIVKEIIGNRVISDSLTEVLRGLKEGEGISKPLKLTNQFPPLALHMIVVGEETGKLDDMLLKVSERYERDVKNTVKRLLALVEPVMILIMGVVIGFIVISMLMAIFSINDIPF